MKANKNREEYCQKACVEWEANDRNLKPKMKFLNYEFIHIHALVSNYFQKFEIQFYPK
jgi:hypothetical protein